MWVRSQTKKKLVNANGFLISTVEETVEILGFISNEREYESWQLGTYSSKEKALKVLDMIQEQIRLNDSYTNYGRVYKIHEVKVFQMPLNSEVE